jgi:hypothetical protein
MDNDNSINCYSSAGLTELSLCQLSLEYDAVFNSFIIIADNLPFVKPFFEKKSKKAGRSLRNALPRE